MKGKQIVTACVTNFKNCETIISEAKKIADSEGCKLYVLNIQKSGEITKEQCSSAEYLFQLCKRYDAQMTIKYTASMPAFAAIEFIKKHKTYHLVTGIPSDGNNGFLNIVSSILPKVKISMVSQKGGIYRFENIFLLKSLAKQKV